MVEDTTGQSNVLTTYCLTDDDKQFVAHSTTQHTDNYQELLDTCRVSTYVPLVEFYLKLPHFKK